MHEAGLNIDQDCKVLTIHRSEDEIIPVEDGLEFAKIIANHKLQIIEGADHCYNKHREELVSTVLAFIKENLHRQRRVVVNKHGEKLVGLLHETGSIHIVVLCHGFQSSKETSTMVNLANALQKEGITAFRFDFAGNGRNVVLLCLQSVLEGKSSRQFITGWVFGVPALKGCSDVRFAENFILILKKRCTK
ncbi:alpha/beta hydrolase fold protein [Tanacetum coccineum]